MNREQRRRLPKAKLLTIEWSWRYFYFARFRCANFRRFQIGWLTIECRAPWIEYVARQNHPHVFADAPSHKERPEVGS